MSVRTPIKKLLNYLGYDLRPLGIRTTIRESYSLLRGLGFQPETIIDVGVATGTRELYETFSDSYFLLIEPLKQFEPVLASISRQYNGSYVLAAAGSSSRQITFNVHANHLDGSSLYKESMGAEADGYEVTVPMVTIDEVLDEKQLNGPYLIKVDAQGAELDVLDGAQRALLDTEVVVLEASLFEFMKGAPQFADVVAYMKKLDFVAYDIILGWNRPLDNALGQVDVVFVKDGGMFRVNHSYSTVEQMKSLFDSDDANPEG